MGANGRYGLLVLAAMVGLTSCTTPSTSNETAAPEQVTLTFASAEPTGSDMLFVSALERLSGGTVTVEFRNYDVGATNVDVVIAKDVAAGRLALADVGSRAWESLGVQSFRAYQSPFLLTNRAQLVRAAAEPVSGPLLSSLAEVGVTGLSVVPIGVRYLFSTRPLTSPADFSGAVVRINTSPTTEAMLTSLGAIADQTTSSGPAAIDALAAGRLTAVEADIGTALDNDYVQRAPYVLATAPLFAKTTTFVAATDRLADLDPNVMSWLAEAASLAQEHAAGKADEAQLWAAACSGGLQPLNLAPEQFTVLSDSVAEVSASISADPVAGAAVAAIRTLAGSSPAVDSWTTCQS